MDIIINPFKEVDEKDFLEQYNDEIDQAEAEIEAGNYIDHDSVEKLFAERRRNK